MFFFHVQCFWHWAFRRQQNIFQFATCSQSVRIDLWPRLMWSKTNWIHSGWQFVAEIVLTFTKGSTTQQSLCSLGCAMEQGMEWTSMIWYLLKQCWNWRSGDGPMKSAPAPEKLSHTNLMHPRSGTTYKRICKYYLPGTVEIGRIVSLEVEAFVSFSASGLLQGIDSPDEVSKSFGIRKAMADQSLLCPHPEPSQTVKKHGRQEAEEWECTLGYGRRKRIRPGNVIKIWINLVVFINYDIGCTNLDRYSLFIILIHVCFLFCKIWTVLDVQSMFGFGQLHFLSCIWNRQVMLKIISVVKACYGGYWFVVGWWYDHVFPHLPGEGC